MMLANRPLKERRVKKQVSKGKGQPQGPKEVEMQQNLIKCVLVGVKKVVAVLHACVRKKLLPCCTLVCEKSCCRAARLCVYS